MAWWKLVIRPSGQLRAQAGTGIIDSWSYPDYLDVRDGAGGLVTTALVYSLAAAAAAFVVAVLAGVPSARRAAAVQPIVAMRAE